MRVRRKKSAGAPAPAVPDDGLVPGVLTARAVAGAVMPELGSSGLTASLEADVPACFRYWKAADADLARSTRDALVETGLFSTDTVLLVDGVPRRIVKRTFLAKVDAADTDQLARRCTPGFAAVARLEIAPGADVRVYEGAEATIEKACADGAGWLVATDDTPAARLDAVEAGHHAFTMHTRPGSLFVSDVALSASATFVDVVKIDRVLDATDVLLAKAMTQRTRLVKSDEQRIAFGIVLEPETKDTQDDVYSEEEIRKAAWRFMENYGNVGHMHRDIVTGKIKILESYVTQVAFDVGDEHIQKGTWLFTVRAVDDAYWEAIKNGELTGFSIGGTAIRKPDDTPVATD